MINIQSLIKSYEAWVAKNPETVGDVETTTKWISYFIAGRISDSSIVSELIYSLSNIMVLYNDRIIDRQRNSSAIATISTSNYNEDKGICYRLKVMLTTLEYCEVFIEISAKRMFGVRGKWCFVVLLQLVKTVGRFFILKHSTDSIITTPAIPSLNRKAFLKQEKETRGNADLVTQPTTSANFTFKLKRSGRCVRKVEGAPPLQYREFNLGSDIDANDKIQSSIPSALLQAEYLYIAKPLLHLASMGIFGEKCWKQYVTALTLDLISIRLYYKNRYLMTKQQKLEMSRRCINLLLYLMRSPLYDRYTQSRLKGLLGALSRNVPLVRLIANPLIEYIPHWQETYFYMWST